MNYEGFQDPKKDEACFNLKEKSQYLPPENQFNPSNQEDNNETTNGNGIYFGLAAAGSYRFLIKFFEV